MHTCAHAHVHAHVCVCVSVSVSGCFVSLYDCLFMGFLCVCGYLHVACFSLIVQ